MHDPRLHQWVRFSGTKQRKRMDENNAIAASGGSPVQQWRYEMKLQHRVQINVAQGDGGTQGVLGSRGRKIPARLLRLLFGEYSEVLVLTPGKSVTSVEIHEIQRGGTEDGRHNPIID